MERIPAQFRHGIAHPRDIDERGAAGRIVHEQALGGEGQLMLGCAAIEPLHDPRGMIPLLRGPTAAERILKQDAQDVW